MSRSLTEEERRLWLVVTKGVKPLASSPVSPYEYPSTKLVVAPRYDNFDPVLDLHGLTIQEAYQRVHDHIYSAKQNKTRKLVIITGKSGPINQELTRWIENRSEISSIKAMNGGGAWEVCLKKDTLTRTY